jgi:multidrug resistance protein
LEFPDNMAEDTDLANFDTEKTGYWGGNAPALDTPQPLESVGPSSTKSQSEPSSGMSDQDLKAVRGSEIAETHDDALNQVPYTSFGPRMKLFIVVMAAWAAFFSPLSGNIYYPALNQLAGEFDVSSSQINLTLTVYMIMQALAPAVVGDFADMYGRRPAYVLGFVVYAAANVGIALVDSFAGLMVLRCLQSAGSSGMIALASGVAADISTSGERGKFMGWTLSGAMLGPAIGPVIGGVLAEYLGWRSIFWFLTILCGCFLRLVAMSLRTAPSRRSSGTKPVSI